MPDRALTGLKVVEFGNLVSAPYCGKMMADLGAEVLKVEEPGRGDEARRREPFAKDTPGMETSGLFAYCNTNKKSITLNVKTRRGRAIFLDLVKEADILVENNPPRLMEQWALTYDILSKVNPMLIMASVTPFGQSGPYRDYKAYELNTYQGSGYGYISTATYKEPVLPPIKGGGRQSEFGAGQAAAVASMTALFARDLIGEGQHVDLSIYELMAGQNESAIEHWTYAENEMGGVTNPLVQPICPLPCKDGYVFLMCVEDHQYDKFVEVMGHPEWVDNELFKNRFVRAEYIDALLPLLSEWSEQHTMEEVFSMAQAAHVPVGPAYNAKEVVESAHLNARNYFVEIDHPVIGRTKYPGAPYILSVTPWKIENPAPLLGQHNEEIYCGRLGYSKLDLVKMTQAGVI